MGSPVMMTSATGKRRGFTIIELLIALALAALILTAATSLLVTFSLARANAEAQPWFNEHADGLERFLRTSFNSGEIVVPVTSPTPDEKTEGERPNRPNQRESAAPQEQAEPAVQFKRLPGARAFDDYYLSFNLPGDTPLLNIGEPNQPTLTAYLELQEEEGLFLLWHGDPEPGREEPEIYRLRLSPYVQAVRYAYFDEDFETWETETEPQEDAQGEVKLPQFLELELGLNEADTRTLTVLLPPETIDAPVF